MVSRAMAAVWAVRCAVIPELVLGCPTTPTHGHMMLATPSWSERDRHICPEWNDESEGLGHTAMTLMSDPLKSTVPGTR